MDSVDSFIGKNIEELQALLHEKKASAEEITRSHLDHIKANDGKTHAFLNVTEELALSQARAVDSKLAAGEDPGPLAGIPVAIKDNICVEGYPVTCGSAILENFVSPYTGTAANNLFAAGAICVGKANLDEFAMGSSNENTSYPIPRNPWNMDRVPGGSSGGPAVSVASGYSVIGIGSDTGGSIRLPASFCGIAGMKPTYGLVSRFGLTSYASSLDQIGPFAATVKDAATALSVLVSEDKKDSTSLRNPFGKSKNGAGASCEVPNLDFVRSLDQSKIKEYCKGLRVGVIEDFLTDALQPEIAAYIDKARKHFESLGATVETISIPHIKEALPVYYIIATAEASANLARFDGVRYGARAADVKDLTTLYNESRQQGFGDEVKRRIMLGTYALSTGYYDAYYKKAQQVRRLIKESFDRVFSDYDVLLSPMSPTVAFKIGEKVDDPLSMYLSDIATLPVNLAGLPGLSVPCGFSDDKMPIGLQLMAGQLSDALLIRSGFALEQAFREENCLRSPVLEAVR